MTNITSMPYFWDTITKQTFELTQKSPLVDIDPMINIIYSAKHLKCSLSFLFTITTTKMT